VVTPVLVVNAFRLLAQEWFVRYELGRADFPHERYGLDPPERLRLALTGLRSIQPGTEGVALLERATLPDGSAAFGRRELRHMGDVRTLLGRALRAQLVVLALLVVLAAALSRSPPTRRVTPLGLLLGSVATLAVAAFLVPMILFGFEGFLVRFHRLFFEGDSWHFDDSDTLLRLYPEVFWEDTAKLAAALTLAQAAALGAASAWWLRRLRPACADAS
jgi:integral membrane protein (TIGR01906 family)